jgi:hypothetical protein
MFCQPAFATGPSSILSGIIGQNGSTNFALAEAGAGVKVNAGFRAP